MNQWLWDFWLRNRISAVIKVLFISSYQHFQGISAALDRIKRQGGLGRDCIKVYPWGQIAKTLLHFNTPGNYIFLFPQKIEWDSYLTSTTL